MSQTRVIDLAGGRSVTATHYRATGSSVAVLVLGHGAGANQHSAFMTDTAADLAVRGFDVVTFNFPYTEAGRRLPDPQPVLEACFEAVVAQVAADPAFAEQPLILGGKSMGGRIASHLAAPPARSASDRPAWWPRLKGLVFLGYPLHPPARPEQVRVSHLPRIQHPLLFVQGERDAFGTPAELRVFVDVLTAPCTLHVVEHGGHSLDVPKRLRIPQETVDASVRDAIAAWVRGIV